MSYMDNVNRIVENSYDFLGQIGKGTYGCVYKCYRKGAFDNNSQLPDVDDRYVAIKRLFPNDYGGSKTILNIYSLREIKILKELKHQNIIQLLDVFINFNSNELNFIYEYEFDLNHIIKHYNSLNERIPVSIIRNFLYQIVLGLSYIHSSYIIHRDIKPQNILINHKGEIKICGKLIISLDFGLSRTLLSPISKLSEVDNVVCTLWYRSPELILGESDYSHNIDIWSTGCIAAELILTEVLFKGECISNFQINQLEKIFEILSLPDSIKWPEFNKLPLYSHIKSWEHQNLFPKTSILSEKLKLSIHDLLYDFIAKLLEVNPNKRINAFDCLKHPFFDNYDSSLKVDVSCFPMKKPI